MFPFVNHRRRALKNGAGEIVKISTEARTMHRPEWWADTYLLSYNLSRGDRSAPIGALQTAETGMHVDMATAEGSVTNELWNRLSRLGYFEAKSSPEDLPDTIRFYHITEKGRQPDMLPAFLIASQAMLNDSNGKVRSVNKFSRKFLSLNFRSLRLPALEALRAAFFSGDEVHADPDEPLARLCAQLVRVRAFQKLGRGSWRPTDESTMIAPFILDTFIYEKS